MTKATGPGRVTRNPNAPLGGIRAVLTNFDVDGDALKPEHILFLDGFVIPLLVGKQPARLFLRGEASHPGSDAHNLELSRRRAGSVVSYLRSRGVPDVQMQIEAAGESLAGANLAENADARAVALLAVKLASIPAPPPQSTPKPSVPTATSFRIRLLGALSAGVGPAQIEQMFFQVWDFSHSVTTFYLYSSAGIGKGAGASMSATLSGPFNDFSTTKAISVDRFGGAARFTTAGAGPFTVNFLNFMGLAPGTATIPNPLKLNTGFTVGLGASTSVGELTPGFTGPFTGP